MVFCIIIFVGWIILGILGSIFFYKMLNILVEHKKGSYLYCHFNLWFSFGFFKKFIDENEFDAKQKEEYLLLYKRGLYTKRVVLIYFALIFLSLWINSIC